MGAWTFTRTATLGGRFQIVVTKLTAGGRAVDVTTVRGVPTTIGGYSDADPFGDSTAQLHFAAITPLDDLDAADLSQWLGHYSNVDIYWVPALDPAAGYDSEPRLDSPLAPGQDVITPSSLRDSSGARTGDNRIKVWEGFIVSLEFDSDDSSASLTATCQGALFQLDHYLAKPFYPPQPWPLELLIADAFDRRKKPQLRTRNLLTQWPDGWKLVVPPYTKDSTTVYTPVGKPGSKWTGYTSRQSGSWDHALTGFVQDQLTVMLTDARAGVTTGNQWTVQHVHQGASSRFGRQPVLLVRDRFRTPDFSMRVGTPGLRLQLSGDATQSENVIYGSGTGVDGTVWRNAVISNDGRRTDYLPLAAGRDVYPYRDNPALVPGAFLSEAYTTFGTGFDQPDATSVAEQSLARDRNPGWTGTITLSTDPSADLPRWLVRSGMTMLLQGFAGTGETGIALHISAAEHNPEDGTVQLTVDSRYRDLLTVQEAIARTRDPLTPVKMLQVNRTSVMIEDVQAPWDYSAGSGYVPKASIRFYEHCPKSLVFPRTTWAEKHPPLHHPAWYVKCRADAPRRAGRWAGPIPILTSEKGTIARTEFYVSDVYGHLIDCPFHVSIYYVPVTVAAMPRDAQGPSPFIDNAFESINPATGQQWPAGNFLAPDQSFIIGWGNQSNGVYNRAGFWPGRESDGASPTGMFVDDASWSFDNTNNPNYNKLAKPGQRQLRSAITLYAMFYAEWTSPVYFQGRLYRQNPGAT